MIRILLKILNDLLNEFISDQFKYIYIYTPRFFPFCIKYTRVTFSVQTRARDLSVFAKTRNAYSVYPCTLNPLTLHGFVLPSSLAIQCFVLTTAALKQVSKDKNLHGSRIIASNKYKQNYAPVCKYMKNK